MKNKNCKSLAAKSGSKFKILKIRCLEKADLPPSPSPSENPKNDFDAMSQNLLQLLKPKEPASPAKSKPSADKNRKDRKQSIPTITERTKKGNSIWNWSNYHLAYIKSLTFDEFKMIVTNVIYEIY